MSWEYPCIYFEKDGVCRKFSDDTAISYCVMGPCPEQTPSNADKIRAMTDEELAEQFLFFRPSDVCFAGKENKNYIGLDGKYYKLGADAVDANLQWLQQSAEDDI